jgi:hypothetical protein
MIVLCKRSQAQLMTVRVTGHPRHCEFYEILVKSLKKEVQRYTNTLTNTDKV